MGRGGAPRLEIDVALARRLRLANPALPIKILRIASVFPET